MTVVAHPITLSVEQFDEWVLRDENRHQQFEYVGGEIFEVVSSGESSEIAITIASYFKIYLLNNDIGRVTGADGGYIIGDQRYIPDVAYISKARQPDRSQEAYNPLPPDLAVEVISPTDSPALVATKVTNYLQAGVIVWVVDPKRRTVAVHEKGKPVMTYSETDTLTADTVLPDFALAVHAIFAD